MADRLRGPFAFALEDPTRGCLYIARDFCGAAPCAYAIADGVVHIAEASAKVRKSVGLLQSVDQLMIGDFLSNSFISREQTFFEGVRRFPPAHWMRIDRDGERKEAYWHLADIPRRGFESDAPERFRELFDRSVAAAYDDGQTAIMLSGGMDSSSIAATLAKAGVGADGIKAYSMTYRQAENWTDAPHLDAIAGSTGFVPREFPSVSFNPLQDMRHWLTVVDGLYLPRGHAVSGRLLPFASADGNRVALLGHGGDEVVSMGFGYLNELARRGQWLRLFSEARAAADVFGENRWKVLRKYTSHSETLRYMRLRLRRRFPSLSPKDPDVPQSTLSADFAAFIGPERHHWKMAASRLDHDERMVQEEAVGLPLQQIALEVMALCGEASGIEVRCPFWDRDLLEYSLSLPGEWKLHDGMSRYILREAMGNDLPDGIRCRRDKYDFSPNFRRGLVANTQELLDLTEPDDQPWAYFLNLEHLRGARDRFSRNGTSTHIADASLLWRVAVMAIWFDIVRNDSFSSAGHGLPRRL